MNLEVLSERQMHSLGQEIGKAIQGGEVLELVGDVGAGKTTLTKGLAIGLEISEPVQSPTFNISRVYAGRDGIELRHYDFYRLAEAGVMADELVEAVDLPGSVVVVEWGGVAEDALPDDRLQISIAVTGEDTRKLSLKGLGPISQRLIQEIAE